MATPFDAAEKLDLAAFRRSLQFMESPRRARGGHARTAGERPDLEYGGGTPGKHPFNLEFDALPVRLQQSSSGYLE